MIWFTWTNPPLLQFSAGFLGAPAEAHAQPVLSSAQGDDRYALKHYLLCDAAIRVFLVRRKKVGDFLVRRQ